MTAAESGVSSAALRLLLDYGSLEPEEFDRYVAKLDRKILRWLAMSHPDNRTRKSLFRATGVPIGAGSVINPGVVIEDGYLGIVSIGKRVAVAPGVVLVADSGPNNSRLKDLPEVRDHMVRQAAVVIEDDCWLGANCVVLPGVTVAAGSVIGAGAVVTADLPPGSVAAGVPARILRRLGSLGLA